MTREELACNCGCGQDTFDVELSWVLEDVRKWFGVRLFVSSGNRCEEHNKAVGGAKASQHLLSKAADIILEGIEPKDVALYLKDKYHDKFGIGLYQDFVHIDVRPVMARW